MTNGFDEMILNMTDTTPEPEDYTGEDGLLYCGKCHKPKEGYFPKETAAWLGRDRHPAECDCQRAEREEREAAEKQRSHLETVERLKRRGFTDPAMQGWTFENDNGKCPQMEHAHFYVENWETMKERNIGYLLWGGVGTGKSYFAGCIANALMEREIPVCMTNFALILGDLAASFEGRNEYISRLCSFPLLILDDFGMERGTEYGLEQVYNVIDSRYRSGRPLIVTKSHGAGENGTTEKADEQKGEPPMTNTPKNDRSTRRPDCVTEIRIGNSVLVVSGYFKQDTTATAADKMLKVLEAEAATQKSAI